MKRKILSIVVLILLVCFVLTSCDTSSLGKDTNSSSSTKEVSSNISSKADITKSTVKSKKTNNSSSKKNTKRKTASSSTNSVKKKTKKKKVKVSNILLSTIPKYSGSPYTEVNGNKPQFTSTEISKSSYEYYTDLDSLGRCGTAVACVGTDIMPTEERGTIGQVKPSGWHTVKYDCVNGKYLYNRCHLIGYQLTGENANPKNLITGTRYLNIEGMLPFENMVADYVKETDNHVMYRVTPIFKGNNLLASGVQMEGYSVEDKGEGISFNVYAYNVQPNIKIDYATGDSTYNGVSAQPTTQKPKVKKKVQPTTTYSYNAGSSNNESSTYILNANSKKFHVPSCSAVSRMKDSNKQAYTGSRSSLISQGYDPCKICNP